MPDKPESAAPEQPAAEPPTREWPASEPRTEESFAAVEPGPESSGTDSAGAGADSAGAGADSAGAAPGGFSSRIAKAGARLRKEAARALAKEPPLPKASPLPPLGSAPSGGLTDGLTEAERAELVEIPDKTGKTLLCMPVANAVRLGLPFRLVAVALYTRQRHLVMHKRRDSLFGPKGVWDLLTSFALAGEATDDAAIRVTAEKTQIGGLHLEQKHRLTHQNKEIVYYAANLPAGLIPAMPDEEFYIVDADELYGLVLDVPELVSPSLALAANSQILF